MAMDLNLDLGELEGEQGRAAELEMLPFATRISVACGFHAGDEDTMRALTRAAADQDVLVGAHTSFRDRENFGRVHLDVPATTLAAETVEQIRTLTEASHTPLSHVKPHGALYHHLNEDLAAADAVAAAVAIENPLLAIITMPLSALADAAQKRGLRVIREGFADRAYVDFNHLAPRDQPGALLDPPRAAAQARALARSGGIDTICVHGDEPEALATLAAVREAIA